MLRPFGYVLGIVLLFSGCLLSQSVASAQGSSSEQDEKGVTAFLQFGGSTNSSGRVFKIDSSLGYNFSSHFGVDAGIPVYYAHSSTATGGGDSNSGIGNPYVDMRLTLKGQSVSYRATVTGYIPVADKKKGFSTGRFTGDWSNRFEGSISRLTPFAEAGVGNTIRDSRFFDRPFTSLGFNAHVEGGAGFNVTDQVELGGSVYGIIPSGQQTIYSRMLHANTGGTMGHGRVFDTQTQTVGTADISRDHGFSAWIGATPGSCVALELGYTRSIEYDLNTVSFNVGVNVGKLLRRNPQY